MGRTATFHNRAQSGSGSREANSLHYTPVVLPRTSQKPEYANFGEFTFHALG